MPISTARVGQMAAHIIRTSMVAVVVYGIKLVCAKQFAKLPFMIGLMFFLYMNYRYRFSIAKYMMYKTGMTMQLEVTGRVRKAFRKREDGLWFMYNLQSRMSGHSETNNNVSGVCLYKKPIILKEQRGPIDTLRHTVKRKYRRPRHQVTSMQPNNVHRKYVSPGFSVWEAPYEAFMEPEKTIDQEELEEMREFIRTLPERLRMMREDALTPTFYKHTVLEDIGSHKAEIGLCSSKSTVSLLGPDGLDL